MLETQLITFLFERIHILDWYDGIVRAIGTQQGKDYLLILAAWDTNCARKVYVIVPIDQVAAELMKRPTYDNRNKASAWKEFTAFFDDYLCHYENATYLTSEEPREGNNFSAKVISASYLHKLKDYEVEEVTKKESVMFWFDLESSVRNTT